MNGVSSLDAVNWRDTCEELDREAFIKAYPHAFLLVLDGGSAEDQDFQTVIMVATGDGDLGAAEGKPGSVHPLLKSGANPYEGRIIIGRARNCDIVLRDPSVSKFHADFREITGGQMAVTDRSSRNGTSVNAAGLVGGKPQAVSSGDRVCFGAMATVFLTAGALHDALC